MGSGIPWILSEKEPIPQKLKVAVSGEKHFANTQTTMMVKTRRDHFRRWEFRATFFFFRANGCWWRGVRGLVDAQAPGLNHFPFWHHESFQRENQSHPTACTLYFVYSLALWDTQHVLYTPRVTCSFSHCCCHRSRYVHSCLAVSLETNEPHHPLYKLERGTSQRAQSSDEALSLSASSVPFSSCSFVHAYKNL